MPFCNLFTSHRNFIVFWERETSLENITYPGPYPYHCFHATFTLLFLFAIIIPCVLSFVNNKTGEIDNLSELRWEQSYRVCVQVRVSRAADTYLSSPESYWRQTLVSSPRENCCCTTSQPYTWGNQRRARSHQASFMAPLPGTPSAKIGEVHTTLYLCFLVFLVYLSVFIFVSYIKNQKNIVCLVPYLPINV